MTQTPLYSTISCSTVSVVICAPSTARPSFLTTGEYQLLLVLLEHAGHILSRDQLLQQTHHRDAGPFDRTIDVQIGRLRKKSLATTAKSPA